MCKALLVLLIAIVACNCVEAGLGRDYTLNADMGPQSFTARTDRTDLSPKDDSATLAFGFSTGGFPRFRVEYFHGSGQDARFKFRVGLLHIAEYNDTTPDFQRANIVPGGGIRLIGRGPAWTNMVYKVDKSSDSLGLQRTDKVTCVTQLVDPKGTVKITAKAVPSYTADGNATLTPNKIKFDLAIENFQYQYPTTKIAVIAVMTMKAAFNPRQNKGPDSGKNGDNEDEVALKSDSHNDGGRFAWVREAHDTSHSLAVVKVKSFPLRDDDTDYSDLSDGTLDDKEANEVDKLVVFVFDTQECSIPTNSSCLVLRQATSLLWDPEVELDDNGGARLTGSFQVSMLLAVAASCLDSDKWAF
jgi:hypothetical protein